MIVIFCKTLYFFLDLLVNQVIRFKTQFLWYMWPRYFPIHYVVEYYLQITDMVIG